MLYILFTFLGFVVHIFGFRQEHVVRDKAVRMLAVLIVIYSVIRARITMVDTSPDSSNSQFGENSASVLQLLISKVRYIERTVTPHANCILFVRTYVVT